MNVEHNTYTVSNTDMEEALKLASPETEANPEVNETPVEELVFVQTEEDVT